ncbi:hypothetical protein, partial [Streptomyces poriferorum]|uniref:hypothetical protein n=1 Tax=Streptomyces poriferorum TaxID=2798799 RepID=UPI001C5DDA17
MYGTTHGKKRAGVLAASLSGLLLAALPALPAHAATAAWAGRAGSAASRRPESEAASTPALFLPC